MELTRHYGGKEIEDLFILRKQKLLEFTASEDEQKNHLYQNHL